MYEYANARIRGLRGHLLRPREWDTLVAQPSLINLISILARGDYGLDLEEAQQRLSGLPLLEAALRRNLSRRMRDLLGFFEAEGAGESFRGRQLVRLLLARYDLANLVAALRGKAAGAAPEEVEASMLPAGLLEEARLTRLAEIPGVAECVIPLQRWGIPYIDLMVSALPEFRKDGQLPPLELALRRGFLEWAGPQLQGPDSNVSLVREALALEVDANNVTTALRLIRHGARLEPRAAAALMLPGGALSMDRLMGLLEYSTPEEAAAALGRSSLGRALSVVGGLGMALEEGVALEWAVERYLARWAQAQVYRDPLGIALALAYHAAKVQEVRSLRLIARATQALWPQEKLRRILDLRAA